MTRYGVDYGRWAVKIITWDTLLPACVAVVPLCLRFVFPDQRGVLEITAVVTPIVAFGFRLGAGKRHIDSNQCSVFTRNVQLFVFCIGLFPLALFECFVILSELMPGGLSGMREDWIAWAILLSVYLVAMIIAMYPGRTEVPAGEGEDLLDYQDQWINEV